MNTSATWQVELTLKLTIVQVPTWSEADWTNNILLQGSGLTMAYHGLPIFLVEETTTKAALLVCDWDPCTYSGRKSLQRPGHWTDARPRLLGSFLIQHGKTDQSHLWMSTLKPSREHFEVCTRMLLASACLDSPATSSLAIRHAQQWSSKSIWYSPGRLWIYSSWHVASAWNDRSGLPVPPSRLKITTSPSSSILHATKKLVSIPVICHCAIKAFNQNVDLHTCRRSDVKEKLLAKQALWWLVSSCFSFRSELRTSTYGGKPIVPSYPESKTSDFILCKYYNNVCI